MGGSRAKKHLQEGILSWLLQYYGRLSWMKERPCQVQGRAKRGGLKTHLTFQCMLISLMEDRSTSVCLEDLLYSRGCSFQLMWQGDNWHLHSGEPDQEESSLAREVSQKRLHLMMSCPGRGQHPRDSGENHRRVRPAGVAKYSRNEVSYKETMSSL